MKNDTSRIVTIDGPSASGKSSVAFSVAQRLGMAYLNSGSIYRYMAYLWAERRVQYQVGMSIDADLFGFHLEFTGADNMRVCVQGSDVTHIITDDRYAAFASKIAAYPEVRAFLLDRQRSYATKQGLVTDGRDMGTVVFPGADLKIFLTASVMVRAERRMAQSRKRGTSLSDVIADLERRDVRDAGRANSPLKPAVNSIEIDTTSISKQAVVDNICRLVEGL